MILQTALGHGEMKEGATDILSTEDIHLQVPFAATATYNTLRKSLKKVKSSFVL